jgi:outer membrane immunogenic protein
MTRLLTASIALAAFFSMPSFAADMPVKAAPLLFDWTGWYLGVNGGYSWGRSRVSTNTVAATTNFSFKHDRGEASGEGGYCWQAPGGTNVTCIEFRYDFPRERSSLNSIGGGGTAKTNVDPFLVGPHFGYLTDANHTIWYLAGGLAVGQTGGTATLGAETGTSSTWTAGGYIGAGIEHMIDQHWSWKVEYDYIRLASGHGAEVLRTHGIGNVAGTRIDAGGNAYDNVVTAGLNYHFGTH